MPAATRISASSTRPRSAIRRCGRCCARTGLPELRDATGCAALREALIAGARRCRAGLGRDRRAGRGPAGYHRAVSIRSRRPRRPGAARPALREIERVIRTCGAHLLSSFASNGFIPTYAAFNLIGDPDLRGRELLMALTGLNARGYKNSTLLFNLARVFIARSPARALINPPWTGIAEPMWEPVQIRHRSAYYDAFFTEALLSFAETGLASPDAGRAPRARDRRRWSDFCLNTSREEVPLARRHARSTSSPRWRRRRIRAFQPLLRADQAGSRLRHLRAGLRHHRLLVLGGDAGRLDRSDPRPAAARFLCRLSGARRRQRAAR